MADPSFRIDDVFAPTSLEAWRALLEKDLKGASFESLRGTTESGLPLEPLYTKENVVDPARVGVPGLPPFTRGAEAGRRGWVIRQEYDDPRADVVRSQIADDMGRGVEAVLLRLGLDAGLRVLTAGDLAHVLGDLDPRATDVWLSPGEDALGIAAAYVAFARTRGAEASELRVSFGADPLGALASRGMLRSGLRGTYRDMRELARFANASGEGMRAVRVDTEPYAEAGAGAVDELAFALSTYTGYLGRLVEWGLDVDAAAAQIDLAVSTGGEFFEQIAKLRALRLLVAKVVKACKGSAEAQAACVHARNGRFTKSQRDPWVNLLRGTAESFAGALGGADSVATTPFDVAYASSDAFARRLARNTQLVLREESKVGEVIDPAGGSYFVERLTEDLARAAWSAFREIERRGGMQAALLSGYVASRLRASDAQRTEALRRRKRVVLGVNEFPSLSEVSLDRAPVDLRDVEGELGREFGEGDQDERYMALIDVNSAAYSGAQSGGGLVEIAASAVTKGADLASLREVLERGEAVLATEPLRPRRAAEDWERLRDLSDACLAREGARPRVFVALLGSVAEHTARSTWVQNLLAAGGFEAVAPAGLETTDRLVAAFRESGTKVALLAGPDARYEEALPALTGALAEAGASTILLAGKPKKDGARDEGVHAFVHVGADVYGVLEWLHVGLGARR
jgi:methylmalonyl-CoA mutase